MELEGLNVHIPAVMAAQSFRQQQKLCEKNLGTVTKGLSKLQKGMAHELLPLVPLHLYGVQERRRSPRMPWWKKLVRSVISYDP